MPLDGLGRMARGAALVLVLMTLLLLLLLLLMLVIGILLFNTTRARAAAAAVQHNARTHSGPPSTGATITMDGGVADTTRTNTGR